MAGELLRTVEAQAAEVALDLSESVGGKIYMKGDGRGEDVDGLDGDGRLGDGCLDAEGHGLDLSLLDSRLDLERGFVWTRRLGRELEIVGSSSERPK